jgi:hypothetical protein
MRTTSTDHSLYHLVQNTPSRPIFFQSRRPKGNLRDSLVLLIDHSHLPSPLVMTAGGLVMILPYFEVPFGSRWSFDTSPTELICGPFPKVSAIYRPLHFSTYTFQNSHLLLTSRRSAHSSSSYSHQNISLINLIPRHQSFICIIQLSHLILIMQHDLIYPPIIFSLS